VNSYGLVATNTATQSENKIHDDAVARQYGFSGGLVPGVVVFAYMTHPPAEQWGLDFLEKGRMFARFVHPVYDGEQTEVVPVGDAGDLEVRKPKGEVCAVGNAALLPFRRPFEIARYPHEPLPANKPPASPEAFSDAPVLGSLDVTFRLDRTGQYLDDIHETLPLYRQEGVAHPGWLISLANYVLSSNVRLGPWIHVESTVSFSSLVHDGDRVSTRALVEEVTERKGHKFVTLDVAVIANDTEAVMHARHTAIYEPRRRRTSEL
jgi:acyl dehydratase